MSSCEILLTLLQLGIIVLGSVVITILGHATWGFFMRKFRGTRLAGVLRRT